MNIFVLDKDPVLAAQYQCDKHVVKMIVETAQLLSTAHRLLDGTLKIEQRVNPKTGKTRRVKVWKLDSDLDGVLYQATHVNHPSNVWVRESSKNYEWTWRHFMALCHEYERRYGRVHATQRKLEKALALVPWKTPLGVISMTPFKLAMKSAPECMHPDDPVRSYREFYQTKQARFRMKWTNREVPTWFEHA